MLGVVGGFHSAGLRVYRLRAEVRSKNSQKYFFDSINANPGPQVNRGDNMTGKFKREALRLAIYIQLLRESPALSDLGNWRRCAADLRRQYQWIKDGVDADKVRQSRIEGRRLIRLHGLFECAQNALPESFRIALALDRERPTGLGERRSLLLSSLTRSMTWSSHRDDSSDNFRLTSKERSNCRRKLKHLDMASAIRHAIGLDDPDVVVYACRACGGLHVGHHVISAKLKKIDLKLTAITIELIPLNRRRAELLNQRKALIERRTKLQASLRLEVDGESP